MKANTVIAAVLLTLTVGACASGGASRQNPMRRPEIIIRVECSVRDSGAAGVCHVLSDTVPECGLAERALADARQIRWEPGTSDHTPLPAYLNDPMRMGRRSTLQLRFPACDAAPLDPGAPTG